MTDNLGGTLFSSITHLARGPLVEPPGLSPLPSRLPHVLPVGFEDFLLLGANYLKVVLPLRRELIPDGEQPGGQAHGVNLHVKVGVFMLKERVVLWRRAKRVVVEMGRVGGLAGGSGEGGNEWKGSWKWVVERGCRKGHVGECAVLPPTALPPLPPHRTLTLLQPPTPPPLFFTLTTTTSFPLSSSCLKYPSQLTLIALVPWYLRRLLWPPKSSSQTVVWGSRHLSQRNIRVWTEHCWRNVRMLVFLSLLVLDLGRAELSEGS